MHKLLVTTAIGLGLALYPAGATEYVVAVNHPQADDAGPGTAHRPWRTLSHAAATVGPGDTVIVRAGLYREQVRFAHSGTGPEAMIRLYAAPGEDVTITALDQITDWEKIDQNVYRKTEWAPDTQMVLVDRQVPLQQIGPSHFSRERHVRAVGQGLDDLFPGSFFCDTEAKILYMAMPAGRPAEWHCVEAAVRDFCLAVGKWTHVRGIRCLGSNYSRFTTWPALSCVSHSIIEDCEVVWADFLGFTAGGEDVTVRRCRFNYCGGVGVTIMGKGHLLEDNVTNHNNWRRIAPGWHAGGMKNTVCTDVTVRRHIAAHNWGTGIWFDIDNRDIVVEESFTYRNSGGCGLHYEISYSGVIRHNVCVENQRNIWSSTCTDVIIEGNTCVGGVEGITLIGEDRGKDYRLQGNVVTRNLCVGNSRCALLVPPDGPFSADNRSDENLFFGIAGLPQFLRAWGNPSIGLQAWRAATGQDAHSLVADPCFADRRALDLRPTAEEARGYGAPEHVLRWVSQQSVE